LWGVFYGVEVYYNGGVSSPSIQLVLGRGELKNSKFILLFVAGFLIQITSVFAQEYIQDVLNIDQSQELLTDDPLRAAELAMTFDDAETALAIPGAGPSTWAIVRMVLVLALAAAAIYGVVFFIKKSSRQAPGNDPFLKVLANAHLGSNRYVHIVSAGSKAWLLGASEGGVNLIGEIEDKDVINAMLLEDSRKSADTVQGLFPDFLSMLRRLGTPAKINAPGADEIRKRRERLKGL
jgi:flagellar protein FliO/FliZ